MLLFILNPALGSSNDSGRGIFEALENDQFSKYLLFVVNLLRGCLNEFGECLHKSWQLKRSFSTKISNPWLDEIYNGAIKNGAIGGKLLGAGGGGYFLFFVPSFDRLKLMSWIKSKGLISTPFIFENNGLQSWTVREN